MMKDRLTYRDGNNRAYFNGNLEDCAERLAAYEDLGLLPEQLVEVDKLYREKCEELAKCKKHSVHKENMYMKEWKVQALNRFTKVQ